MLFNEITMWYKNFLKIHWNGFSITKKHSHRQMYLKYSVERHMCGI